ncbi:hypothetical protein [Pararhizobium sp. A13]
MRIEEVEAVAYHLEIDEGKLLFLALGQYYGEQTMQMFKRHLQQTET